MGASATLSALTAVAEPGGEATLAVTVRNTGQVVDEITVDVVGAAGEWATVDPPTLRLFPGTEGSTTVTFRPPRDAAVAAGDVPFGLRVTSREDPDGSAVEEGVLTVAAFSDVTLELLPRTSRGRRRAKADVAIDNRGNAPLGIGMSATDPDAVLRLAVDPPALIVEAGQAVFAKLDIRPVRRFWRGATKTLPFQVAAQPEGQAVVTTDGVFVQEQILPKWLLKALIALIALILLLVVLWFTLLRPTIESAAEDAVAEEIAPLEKKVDAAAAAAEEPPGGGGGGGGGAEPPAGEEPAGEEPAGGEPGATTLPANPLADIGVSTDFRIVADPATAPGDTQTYSFTDPDGQLLSLTDIVFQNPNGDIGRLEVLRGDDVLLSVGLANFRDLDYHFVSPVRFAAGEAVRVRVSCVSAGTATPAPADGCTPAVYFAGGRRPPPAAG